MRGHFRKCLQRAVERGLARKGMERGQAKAWQIVVLDKLHMEKFRPEADAGEAKGPKPSTDADVAPRVKAGWH